MILANGCNITKSEKFKGVWILSVPTVYRYRDIEVVILWYKILVISPTPTTNKGKIKPMQWESDLTMSWVQK